MSCCNISLKESDLINLDFVSNQCDFNRQVESLMNSHNVEFKNKDFCNKERFIVRFQNLNDNRIVYTIEDTVNNNITYLESESMFKTDTPQIVFERLMVLYNNKFNQKLDSVLNESVYNYNESNINPLTFVKLRNELILLTHVENELIITLSLEFKITTNAELLTDTMDNLQLVRLIGMVSNTSNRSVLRTIKDDMNFKLSEYKVLLNDDKSFEMNWVKKINDNEVIELKVKSISNEMFDKLLTSKQMFI